MECSEWMDEFSVRMDPTSKADINLVLPQPASGLSHLPGT